MERCQWHSFPNVAESPTKPAGQQTTTRWTQSRKGRHAAPGRPRYARYAGRGPALCSTITARLFDNRPAPNWAAYKPGPSPWSRTLSTNRSNGPNTYNFGRARSRSPLGAPLPGDREVPIAGVHGFVYHQGISIGAPKQSQRNISSPTSAISKSHSH